MGTKSSRSQTQAQSLFSMAFTFAEPPKPRASKAVGRSGGGDGLSEKLACWVQKLSENYKVMCNLLTSIYEKLPNEQVIFSETIQKVKKSSYFSLFKHQIIYCTQYVVKGGIKMKISSILLLSVNKNTTLFVYSIIYTKQTIVVLRVKNKNLISTTSAT